MAKNIFKNAMRHALEVHNHLEAYILKDVNKITIHDLTSYDPDRCSTGGNYAFYTIYTRVDDDMFEVSYDTTAEFDYCPVCGSFNNHRLYDDQYDFLGYKCGRFETITSKELYDILNAVEEADDYYIRVD